MRPSQYDIRLQSLALTDTCLLFRLGTGTRPFDDDVLFGFGVRSKSESHARECGALDVVVSIPCQGIVRRCTYKIYAHDELRFTSLAALHFCKIPCAVRMRPLWR